MTVLELCSFSTHLFPPGTPLLESNGASLISRISSDGELSLTAREGNLVPAETQPDKAVRLISLIIIISISPCRTH